MPLGFRRALLVAALGSSLLACAEERTVVFGEIDSQAQSVVLAFAQGDLLNVYAAQGEQRIQLELPSSMNEEEPVLVSRIHLSTSLANLGVAPGWLESAPSPSRRLGDVPRLASDSALMQFGNATGFVDAEPEPALLDFRLPYPPCPRWRFEPIPELASAGWTDGRTVLPDGRVLISGSAGLVVLEENEAPRFLPLPSDGMVRTAVSPQGNVWFLSATRLARLDVETGTVADEVARPPLSELGALVVLSETPLIVHVRTARAEFWELRDGVWSLASNVPELRTSRGLIGRVTMLTTEEGGYLAAASFLGALVRYELGYHVDLEVGANGRGFSTLDRTRAGDLFVAEEKIGQTLILREGGWVLGPKIDPANNSVTPYGEGDLLLFVNGAGALGLMSPEEGLVCGPSPLSSFGALQDVARIGSRYFLAGLDQGDVPELGWLVPE